MERACHQNALCVFHSMSELKKYKFAANSQWHIIYSNFSNSFVYVLLDAIYIEKYL